MGVGILRLRTLIGLSVHWFNPDSLCTGRNYDFVTAIQQCCFLAGVPSDRPRCQWGFGPAFSVWCVAGSPVLQVALHLLGLCSAGVPPDQKPSEGGIFEDRSSEGV